MATIQERIDSAKKRRESTLNLSFPVSEIGVLVKKYQLNVHRDGLSTIVQGIGQTLGVDASPGDFQFSIEYRIKGRSSATLSFTIDSVYRLCRRFNIDPTKQRVRELADAIFREICRLIP